LRSKRRLGRSISATLCSLIRAAIGDPMTPPEIEAHISLAGDVFFEAAD